MSEKEPVQIFDKAFVELMSKVSGQPEDVCLFMACNALGLTIVVKEEQCQDSSQ